MDVKANVKMLVQQVVEAYLKDQLHKNLGKSIGILLGYPSTNPTEVLEPVTELVDSYDVTLFLTKEWLPLPSQLCVRRYILLEETTQNEWKKIVENTLLLVVPVASFGLLSKLALTMDDEAAAWIAIQYQLLGKPVVMASNHVEPNVYQQILTPHSVQERLQSYIRQIRSDQVKWEPLSKLLKMVEQQLKDYEEKQSLILGKHIEMAHQDGLKKIVVPAKSRVTPVAKDLAKELNVEIMKQDSLKGGEL